MSNESASWGRKNQTDVDVFVNAVSGSLLSPRIIARKLATDTLTFMISYNE